MLSQNLIHGDALAMRTRTEGRKSCKPSATHGGSPSMRRHTCQPIIVAEWGCLGKGKFQRRDFRLDNLTLSSAFSAQDSLFAQLGKHDIFSPARTYRPMTVGELAVITQEATR